MTLGGRQSGRIERFAAGPDKEDTSSSASGTYNSRPRTGVSQPRGVVDKHTGLWSLGQRFESARGY